MQSATCSSGGSTPSGPCCLAPRTTPSARPASTSGSRSSSSVLPAATDDEVDLRAAGQDASGPPALGDDDAPTARAGGRVADLAGTAMPLRDRAAHGREPYPDDVRHPARSAGDREPARDVGGGVVVRVARL